MPDLADIYESVIVGGYMSQLAQEQVVYGNVGPDVAYSSVKVDVPGDPAQQASHYGNNYQNGNPSHYGDNYGGGQQGGGAPPGLPNPMGKYNPKASWDIARRAMQTGILPGMNNGTAGTLKDKRYHWEALDPKHRMGNLLELMYKKFDEELTKANADEYARKLSLFFAWLDEACHVCPDEVKDVLAGWQDSEINNFITAGVAYLSGPQRIKHQLTIRGGKIYLGDQPFDTTALKTAFSGIGWAIYVVSPTAQWYAGSHIVGEFHHSSFLSGKPVMSAGEMVVKNGQLKTITAKSGHYKPTKEQFLAGLRDLKSKGINMELVMVEVFEKANAPRPGAAAEKRIKMQVPAHTFIISNSRFDIW